MVKSTAKIFADDTKILNRILNRDDHQQMQAYLNYLVKWSEEWQFGFNESKCKVLHLGTNNPKLEYQMKSVTLMTDTAEKDLGVTIDNKLKFHHHIGHISNAVNKASRMLGLS